MEDIKECIGGIQQPVARLAVLEGLYAALFTTTSHHVAQPTTTSGAGGDGSAAALFIAQEKVVAPVLALIASSLAGVPDSRRKLGLVELVEEAQWRLDLIRAFARSPRGRALVPAHGALPSVMARMSASPDGLAANCLRVNGTNYHLCVLCGVCVCHVCRVVCRCRREGGLGRTAERAE